MELKTLFILLQWFLLLFLDAKCYSIHPVQNFTSLKSEDFQAINFTKTVASAESVLDKECSSNWDCILKDTRTECNSTTGQCTCIGKYFIPLYLNHHHDEEISSCCMRKESVEAHSAVIFGACCVDADCQWMSPHLECFEVWNYCRCKRGMLPLQGTGEDGEHWGCANGTETINRTIGSPINFTFILVFLIPIVLVVALNMFGCWYFRWYLYFCRKPDPPSAPSLDDSPPSYDSLFLRTLRRSLRRTRTSMVRRPSPIETIQEAEEPPPPYQDAIKGATSDVRDTTSSQSQGNVINAHDQKGDTQQQAGMKS